MRFQLLVMAVGTTMGIHGQWQLEHVISPSDYPGTFQQYQVRHSRFANGSLGAFTESVYVSPSSGTFYSCRQFSGNEWSPLMGVGGAGQHYWQYTGIFGLMDPPILYIQEISNYTMGGYAFRTFDGSNISEPFMIHWGHIAFHAMDQDHLFLIVNNVIEVGADEYIERRSLMTRTYGVDQDSVFLFMEQEPWKMYFADVDHGFIIASLPDTTIATLIIATTNGGYDWQTVFNDPTSALRGLHFVSPTTGTVVGDNGLILRTIDGGATWSQQASGTTADLKHVLFLNEHHGFAAGNGGTMLTTWNGGESWSAMSFPSTNTITDLYQVSDHVLYAHIGPRMIYKWDTYTHTTEVDKRPQVSIHPNPTSGVFTVRSAERIERMMIVDPLGRVVRTIAARD